MHWYHSIRSTWRSSLNNNQSFQAIATFIDSYTSPDPVDPLSNLPSGAEKTQRRANSLGLQYINKFFWQTVFTLSKLVPKWFSRCYFESIPCNTIHMLKSMWKCVINSNYNNFIRKQYFWMPLTPLNRAFHSFPRALSHWFIFTRWCLTKK